MSRAQSSRENAQGFTVVELLVYMTLVSVVVGSIFRLIVSQNANYRHQRELSDLRDNLRGALVVLSSEIRQISSAGGDVYAVSAESLTVRSVSWSGIVCGKHDSPPRFGLSSLDGEVQTILGDSALVLATGIAGNDDDTWRPIDVTKEWSSGGGVASCVWGGNPERVIEFDGDTTGIRFGSPIRGFRTVQYGIFPADGRWWLGRKTEANSPYQKLAGPVRSPALGGLEFLPYDSTGGPTVDPLAVRTVEVVIRAESFGKLRGGSSGVVPTVRYDSLRTVLFPRG